MNAELKTVRKKMLAGDLKGIIDLPNYDDNQLVEILIHPVAEKQELTLEERRAIIKSLTGCLKGADTSKTLDDWRTERLTEKFLRSVEHER